MHFSEMRREHRFSKELIRICSMVVIMTAIPLSRKRTRRKQYISIWVEDPVQITYGSSFPDANLSGQEQLKMAKVIFLSSGDEISVYRN